MVYTVYKVKKIDGYYNNYDLPNDHDYMEDFEKLRKSKAHLTLDYIITNSDLEVGKVYFKEDRLPEFEGLEDAESVFNNSRKPCDRYGKLILPLKKMSRFEEEEYKSDVATTKVPIKDINPGDHFKYNGFEIVKLDDIYGGCFCYVCDETFGTCYFDKGNNNWGTSWLRNSLAENIGLYIKNQSDLELFTRDLVSDDGLTIYGTYKDRLSILTCQEYRRYRKFIPAQRQVQWTITANSPISPYYVRVILADGTLADSVVHTERGVYPVLVLKPGTLIEL